ncbi:MAG: DUF3306 domain-containing protein [Burkholderiales bacterium]|nr:DUF3306 domain-containing protein [Burkholderiales bacterium]
MSTFLKRWSARKREQQAVLVDDSTALPPALESLPDASQSDSLKQVNVDSSGALTQLAQDETDQPLPGPSLDDVARLTRESDFSSFVTKDIHLDVHQAAMKKLFTDPHYNIMDGLDIYIDDYSKEDPLPPGMLEMMRQSDMLGLFKKVLDKPVMSVDATNAPDFESFVVQEKTSSIEDCSIKDPLVLESQSLDEDNTLDQHQTGGADPNAIPLNPIAGKAL